MTQQNISQSIRVALKQMSTGNLSDSAAQLLATLDYRSNRRLDGQTGKITDFITEFRAEKSNTRSEQDFCNSVREIRILFQLTNTEIATTQGGGGQDTTQLQGFNTRNTSSFLFITVELKEKSYARSRYACFTREVNKRLKYIPAVLIFRTTNGQITLAFVGRRSSKKQTHPQALGKVSLIREIDATNPHRAHLDILEELSLPKLLSWIEKNNKPYNFDGLLNAWLDTLDTEELNRRFYRDLLEWFDDAVKTAKFPKEKTKTLGAEEHVIRLITRMMFVWFIKEKGLVSEDLFIENKIQKLLRNYDRPNDDSYYRVVLQNLFFATLNTEIDHRGFNTHNNKSTNSKFSCYHYRKEMYDPKTLLMLFNKTPFINGGIFDCLDNLDTTSGGYHIDCFSDTHYSKLSIPNYLFFSQGGGGHRLN